jgi:hypothetical protein
MNDSRRFGTGLPFPDFGGYQEYCKLKADLAAKVRFPFFPVKDLSLLIVR